MKKETISRIITGATLVAASTIPTMIYLIGKEDGKRVGKMLSMDSVREVLENYPFGTGEVDGVTVTKF